MTAEAPTRKSAYIGAIFGAAGVEKVDLAPTLHLLAPFLEWQSLERDIRQCRVDCVALERNSPLLSPRVLSDTYRVIALVSILFCHKWSFGVNDR